MKSINLDRDKRPSKQMEHQTRNQSETIMKDSDGVTRVKEQKAMNATF